MKDDEIVEISFDGDKFWYDKNKTIHRVNGPAIEWINGDREWYVNGLLHREDGPACEYTNGIKCWYVHGKRHRIDGPAIHGAYSKSSQSSYNGTYWINGKQYKTLEEGLMDNALE